MSHIWAVVIAAVVLFILVAVETFAIQAVMDPMASMPFTMLIAMVIGFFVPNRIVKYLTRERQ